MYPTGSCGSLRELGGSGLGLFISRRLTEMHGGAIGFASEAGVGSTFAFYVRSRNATSSRRQDSSSTATAGLGIHTRSRFLANRACDDKDQSPAPLDDVEVAASDLYVLVVEDNIVNQRVLAKQLRTIGINVAVANHGVEALDYLRTTTYCVANEAQANKLSLILMDWEMPVRRFGALTARHADHDTGDGWLDLRAAHSRTAAAGCCA